MQCEFAPRALSRAVCLAAILFAAPVAASAEEYIGRTPPRLSLIEGQASVWRSGAEEWEAAEINLPLAPGDFLYTGDGSRIEIQIGAGAFVRAAGNTQIGLLSQEGEFLRLDVAQGRATLDLRNLQPGAQIEVETPQGKLSLAQSGLYDIDVAGDRARFAARQGGRGIVVAGTDSRDLNPGTELIAAGARPLTQTAAAPSDDWDRWNSERTDRVLAATSRSYVSEDVYGVRDLDDHGVWRSVPTYGQVWVPANVGPNWAPYTTGRWYWDAGYGWTWIDSAPWGWAPYHYGRWVYVNNFWGWAPGPFIGAPVYSPALVAFFGGPSVSVSIGVPFVSWVALGWGEPIVPWWGPSWYRGYPCWNGWGGPTVINNIYIDKRKTIYANDIKRYSNQRQRDAVVSVRRDAFARRNAHRQRLGEVDRQNLRPVHGRNPVEPREAGIREVRERTRPTRPDRPQIARAGGAGEIEGAARDPRERNNAQRPQRSSLAEQGSERSLAARERPQRPLPSRGGSAESGSDIPVLRDRPERPARERSDMASRERPQMDGRTRPQRPVPSRDLGGRPPRPPRDTDVAARPRPDQSTSPRQRVGPAAPAGSQPRPERPSAMRPQSPPVTRPNMDARTRPDRPTSFDRLSAPRSRPQQPSRLESPSQAPRVEQPRVEQPQMSAPRVERPNIDRPNVQPQPQPQYSAPTYRGFDSPSRGQAQVQMPQQQQPRMQMPQSAQPQAASRSRGADFGGRAPDRGGQARPQRGQ